MEVLAREQTRGSSPLSPEALARLYRARRAHLIRVAQRIVASDVDAEDVVQQAFLNGLIHGARFDGRAQPSSWLFRVTTNAALMHLRARRRRTARVVEDDDALADHQATTADPAASPETRALARELARDVADAARALSPVDRDIAWARWVDERSTEEVAARTGLSPAAVKSRVFRARERLAAALSPCHGAEAVA